MLAARQLETLEVSTLALRVEGTTLTVTIDQQSSLNALSLAVVHDLRLVFGLLRSRLATSTEKGEIDWSIRGVILTGSGEKAFVAGADIRALAEMTEPQVRSYAGEVHELLGWIETLPVPVIAAVNGYALGGGLELALACDMVYASAHAKFGLPEVSLGIIPGFGGCIRLQRVVGPALASEMIFTGRHVDTTEAARVGLTTQIFSDIRELHAGAQATLQQVAKNSPAAVAQAKQTVTATRELPLAEGIAVELDGFANRFGTPDMLEGTAAFTEKRAPQFRGQ